MSRIIINGRATGYGPWGFDPLPQNATREQKLEHELKLTKMRLDEVTSTPKMVGTVFAVFGEKKEMLVVQIAGGQLAEVRRPRGLAGVGPGARVRLTQPTPSSPSWGVESVVEWPQAGEVARVVDLVSEELAIILVGNAERSVNTGIPVAIGDRVVLDGTCSVVVQNIGKPPGIQAYTGETGVEWDDIAGLADAKRALREALEEPVLHKDTYARFGQRPARGVLLWGPPGTGKTMLGRAAATALARLHKDAAPGGFIYVKGPELLHLFVGSSEANVRKLFAQAREYRAATGARATIFVDEADALLGKRGANKSIEGMETTVVPQFLSEMDGLDDAGAFVMLATNRADTLDPAITRDGRIDSKIYVGRPDQATVQAIFAKNLATRPIDGDAARLAERAAMELFSDRRSIATVRAARAAGPGKRPEAKEIVYALKHLVSGAMAAALVGRATQLAIRRALAGATEATIGARDMSDAIAEVHRENLALENGAGLAPILTELADDGWEVQAIARAKDEPARALA